MNLSRKQWFVIVILVAGSFITILNQTVITPAIPSIMAEMNVDASTAQWLTTGFTLVNAIMIPVTAYLQDRFAARRLFIISMLLFALGSFLTGFALSFPTMLTGRLIQAMGAGILMPLTMTVLLITFPVDKRGSAMGIFGLVTAFAPAIGPTLAGIVIDTFDWHILFFGITAASLVVILLAVLFFESKKPDHHGDSSLDPLSLTLSTLGFGTLLAGYSFFGSDGPTPFTIGLIAVGTVGVVWFFVRQTRLEHPMLRVGVLKNRRFLIATVIGMVIQSALLAASILMPIYIQSLLGLSATMSGLVMLPGALLMGIMNPVAGKLFDKHGPRKLGIVGTVILTISTLGFATLSLETPIILLSALYVIRVVSLTLVNMPITTWGMNALDTKYMNHGTSVNNTLRQVAGSMGTAVVVAVSTLTQNAAQANFGMAAAEAQLTGINVAFGMSAVLCLVAAVLTIIFVKDTPKENAEVENATERRYLVESIMKRDVYTLPQTATVLDAMQLFVDKKISAAPIVDKDGHAVGFISDGDILKRLAPRNSDYNDPIIMMLSSVRDNRSYDERLEQLMNEKVGEIGVRHSINVDVHSDLPTICGVLSSNHLKKVPVVDEGIIVGIVNRSDITQYSMEKYLNKKAS